MIKSEKGTVIVRGEACDVIYELTHLLNRLIEKNPEIITSILTVYTDELENALLKVNPRTCAIINELASKIKKDLEDD
jgi:hypothetical protein